MWDVKENSGWTLRVGAVLLGTLCLAWGVSAYQLSFLEQELGGLAQAKIEEFRPTKKGLESSAQRIGAEVAVARPYILFGPAIGKISVYVEHSGSNNEPRIEGYEFFYTRQGSEDWVQTESGRCVSDQCSIDGKRVLDAFGETL